MINSKELYFRGKGVKHNGTKTNNQLLEDVYLSRIISEMYELVVTSALKDNKYKVTYNPEEPIPIRYQNKIEDRFSKALYEIKFMKDTTNKYIMHIVVNCELEEYKKELEEDKVLGEVSKEEVYTILKLFYTNLTKEQFQYILDDIRLNHPTVNQHGYNYVKLFSEIEYYYNSYYKNEEGIKMRRIYQANGYDRLFQIGALSYDSDKDIKEINEEYKPVNRYTYFYNYLERYSVINRNAANSLSIVSIGRILQDYLFGNKTSIYDPDENKLYRIDENISDEDTDKCVKLLLKGLYKAETIYRIMRFIQTYYANKFSTNDDIYSLQREMPITEEMRKKYDGLSEDLMRHVYFSNSGPNRLLILERSPEVTTKSNYDRLRIQFSILGTRGKKKYLEDNKEEILKYIIDKVSKNKYFKKVPINCFAVTRIGMNNSGDVTVIMELKKELLDMDKTSE